MFPNFVQQQILIELSKQYSDELVVAAIKIAGSKDVVKGRAINFIEAVLKEWENNNVKTLEQAREYEKRRNQVNKKSNFNNKKVRKTESLPSWAEKSTDTSKADEVVELDEDLQKRLDDLRKRREVLET